MAVKYLRSRGDIGRIGLWGRSMGAVSALMYAAKDPSIACMVRCTPRKAAPHWPGLTRPPPPFRSWTAPSLT